MIMDDVTKIRPYPGTIGWSEGKHDYVTIISETKSEDLIARKVKYILFKDGAKRGYEYEDGEVEYIG
jgi:predicted RNA-binding protein with TRAM domain